MWNGNVSSRFNFRFIFYKIGSKFWEVRKNRIVILDVEKHEIIHPVPSFLMGRKLMVSSNQLEINLHTGSGSSGISFQYFWKEN